MPAGDGSNARRPHRPFDAIVRAYIGRIRPRAQAEFDWFARQPSLQSAIRNAALAVNSRGKRYSHQRRLTRAALEDAYAAVSERAKQIGEARDFDQLFNIVGAAVDDIPGLGELYVQDTALRICAKLNLFPTRVYLHAGTREGARALGLDARTDALYIADLPRKFHALKPHEIEDVLYIFKDELASSRQTLPRASRRSWCA
jgi:hypothetical protein